MTRAQWLLTVASILSLSSLVTGCGSIRVVKRTQDGGIVALAGSQSEARKKADEYMTGQCGGGYEIVEEGEAVIGEVSSAESRPTRYGTMQTQGSSTQKTEWRLTFRCKANAAPTAKTPAGPRETAELHSYTVRF